MARASLQIWRRVNPVRHARIDGAAVYESSMRYNKWRIQNHLECGYFDSPNDAMAAADKLFPIDRED